MKNAISKLLCAASISLALLPYNGYSQWIRSSANTVTSVNQAGATTPVRIGINMLNATTLPTHPLHVRGGVRFQNLPAITGSGNTSILYYNATSGEVKYGAMPGLANGWLTSGTDLSLSPDAFLGTLNYGDIKFHTDNGTAGYNAARQRMIISAEGDVGIGTANANYPKNKLLVEGGTIVPNVYMALGIINPTQAGIINVSNFDISNTGITSAIPSGDGKVNMAFNGVVSGGAGATNTVQRTHIYGQYAAINKGSYTTVLGDNAPFNYGSDIRIQGNSSTNYGSSVLVVGAGSDNTAILTSTEGASANNKGIDVRVMDGTTNNTAVTATVVGANTTNTGVLATATGTGSYNYGVVADLSNATGNVNYAVYAKQVAGTSAGSFSPAQLPVNTYSNFAGYFDGDVFAANTFYYSDAKLKTNISPFTGALEKLNKLQVKNYTFRQTEFPGMNLPQGLQVGLLSTELKEVFPNLVKQAVQPEVKGVAPVTPFEAVNYNALIPVLIQGVQELDEKNNMTREQLSTELNQVRGELAELKNKLNELLGSGNTSVKNTASLLEDAELYQSMPNPASGNATIGYFINRPFTTAEIRVVSAEGKPVRQYKITSPGTGSVHFNGSEVISGTYKYSLYVDEQLYGTRSMVIAKN